MQFLPRLLGDETGSQQAAGQQLRQPLRLDVVRQIGGNGLRFDFVGQQQAETAFQRTPDRFPEFAPRLERHIGDTFCSQPIGEFSGVRRQGLDASQFLSDFSSHGVRDAHASHCVFAMNVQTGHSKQKGIHESVSFRAENVLGTILLILIRSNTHKPVGVRNGCSTHKGGLLRTSP